MRSKEKLTHDHLSKALNLILKKIPPWEKNGIPEYITTKEIINRIKAHFDGYNIDSLFINNELLKRNYIESVDPIDGVMKWKIVELEN